MNSPEAGQLRGSVQWFALAVSLTACFGAAALGSLWTTPNIPSWYAGLEKPSWTPPNWLFGPVWTLLYAAMAVAAWLVWRQRHSGAGVALGLFALQLALNTAWSWLFFGRHQLGAAFFELVALWVAIAATCWAFWKHSRLAAALLIPYLAWVSFAGALNCAIWLMNSG